MKIAYVFICRNRDKGCDGDAVFQVLLSLRASKREKLLLCSCRLDFYGENGSRFGMNVVENLNGIDSVML